MKTILCALLFLLVPLCGRADDIIVYVSDLPPYSMPHDPKRPGFNIELVREAMMRAGIGYRLEPRPWGRAQQETRFTPASLIVGLTPTPERGPHYAWIAPLLNVDILFVSRRPQRGFDSLDQARLARAITVRAETAFETILRNAGFGNVGTVQSEESNARKLYAGRADAWLTSNLRGLYVWTTLGFPVGELVYGKPIASEPLYLAAHTDFPHELADRIRAAMASVRRDGTYDRLFRRYFGIPDG